MIEPRYGQAMGSAAGIAGRAQLPERTVPAGAYLLWITGQTARSNKPAFKWEFPKHFYLYLAMRDLEAEGRWTLTKRDDREERERRAAEAAQAADTDTAQVEAAQPEVAQPGRWTQWTRWS